MSATGTIEPAPDGRSVVTFVRDLGHPVERVWTAITQTEHLRSWFPADVDLTLELVRRSTELPPHDAAARPVWLERC